MILRIILSIGIVFIFSRDGLSQSFEAKVLSVDSQRSIEGATVIVNDSLTVFTDKHGVFKINIPPIQGGIKISHLGFIDKYILYPLDTDIIYLESESEELNEVVISTGYYKIPQDRATGSYSHVSNELINRTVSTDIISRLEGVTSSLQFDRRRMNENNSSLDLRIRGLGTIYADSSPLIVLNGFPYEGDINGIDPADVEDITVLKDAAAASIWGAKAGNGVIVINSKASRYNQKPKISFSGGINIKERPDLFYTPNFLSSEQFIGVEKNLFSQGYYNIDENSLQKNILSPVVELLIAQRDGDLDEISVKNALDRYKGIDIRREMSQEIYRREQERQASLSLKGGSEKVNYLFTTGWNENQLNQYGNSYERLNVRNSNNYKLSEDMEIAAGIHFTQQASTNNGPSNLFVPTGKTTVYPYAELKGDNGTFLPIVKDYRMGYIEDAQERGLLDWKYYPLADRNLVSHDSKLTDLRINGGLKYDVIKQLSFELMYQFHKTNEEATSLYDKDSYHVRDLVNRFTQSDGSKPLPYGDILQISNAYALAHFGRAQINYKSEVGDKHSIFAIAGTEVSEIKRTSSGFGRYGFDNDILTYVSPIDFMTRFPILPRGTARIGNLDKTLNEYLDRTISYYGNASYEFDRRYIYSISSRWDASNLFGVKTNQKGIPLWSTGIAWNLDQEEFYNFQLIPFVKLRATYGYNGNINRAATAYTTATYRTDEYTGYRSARIAAPGNPSLRWEKIETWNIGTDIGMFANKLRFKFDWYRKYGIDLLGRVELDPTTGFQNSPLATPYYVNYANIVTKGWDFEIGYKYQKRFFSWYSNLLLNVMENTVKNYKSDDAINTQSYFRALSNLPPIEGVSLDAFYSIPWKGLNPDNGNPRVLIDDILMDNKQSYIEYMRDLVFDDLLYSGVSVPPAFGSFRNTFFYRRLSASFMLTFKAGYHFRRSSVDYMGLTKRWEGHRDFLDRWKTPGDEVKTKVPSMPSAADLSDQRDLIYLNSDIMVERGDHIRLQDITFSYDFTPERRGRSYNNFKIHATAQNLGIIWRANKWRIDPDYPSVSYLPSKSISISLTADF